MYALAGNTEPGDCIQASRFYGLSWLGNRRSDKTQGELRCVQQANHVFGIERVLLLLLL